MVVGVVHKLACVLKEQGACVREGKGLLSCLHALCRQLKSSFDSYKVERENQNKTLLPFSTVKKQTSSLQRGAEVFFLSVAWSCMQAVWMHIMFTIEQRSTVEPWKPNGRGWEFLDWRSSEYFAPLCSAAWETALQICQSVFVVLLLLLCSISIRNNLIFYTFF